MARTVNYNQKIESLKAKVEKKSEEVKELKALLADLEQKKLKEDFKTLNEYLSEKGIVPEDALAKLKECFGE